MCPFSDVGIRVCNGLGLDFHVVSYLSYQMLDTTNVIINTDWKLFKRDPGGAWERGYIVEHFTVLAATEHVYKYADLQQFVKSTYIQYC